MVMTTMDRDPKKRVYSPTGKTPLKRKSKGAVPFRERNVPAGQLNAKKTLTYQCSKPLSEEDDQALTQFLGLRPMMEPEDHLQIFGEMFAAYCSRQNVTVPEDYLKPQPKQ